MNHDKYFVDAVIFDLDGTLIDSTDTYFKIIEVTFDQLGLPEVSRRDIYEAAKDGDFKWDRVLPKTAKHQENDIIDAASAIINRIYPEMFQKDVKLVPGADRFLKSLFKKGIKLGIATSTPRNNMEYKLDLLEREGIKDLISAIVTNDDVTSKKPDPEPLFLCAKQLDTVAEKCLYIGDTRIDIKAGKSAGMISVGVLTGFEDYSLLKTEKPDEIVDSVSELSEKIDKFDKHFF